MSCLRCGFPLELSLWDPQDHYYAYRCTNDACCYLRCFDEAPEELIDDCE